MLKLLCRVAIDELRPMGGVGALSTWVEANLTDGGKYEVTFAEKEVEVLPMTAGKALWLACKAGGLVLSNDRMDDIEHEWTTMSGREIWERRAVAVIDFVKRETKP
jgi:hypothetical protein